MCYLLGLKMQKLFIYLSLFFFFGGGGGGSSWWLAWPVHVTFWPFQDILGGLTRSTAHCHRRKEQNVLVCFHCLCCVAIVTLNRSYRIRTYTPDTADHGELFRNGFGWDDSHPYAHTEAKYTGIMRVLFLLWWDEFVKKKIWSSLNSEMANPLIRPRN